MHKETPVYYININISIYCISFFVKAVLSYKCMDAMHHGLSNKMYDDKMICTHRDTTAGNEINLPCLCIVHSVAVCPGGPQELQELLLLGNGRQRSHVDETTVTRDFAPALAENRTPPSTNPQLMQ